MSTAHTYRRLMGRYTGSGKMVFPDGSVVSVLYLIEVHKAFTEDHVPLTSQIGGRVWSEADPLLAHQYLGKDCILEMEGGRRFSMFICDSHGTVAHSHGIVEGFPEA